MMTSIRARIAVLLLLTFASGCAHGVSRRTRIARVLVGTGAAVTVAGGLVAAGCVSSSSEHDGCSGGPGDADLAAGIPIMVLGAGLIVGGLLARDKDGGRLLPPPNSMRGRSFPPPY